jgi:hypothetical protein
MGFRGRSAVIMDNNLTKKEAYMAMFSFLEEYYLRTKSDDIGSLLSGMCLMGDGMPMDKAYWSEWTQAVQKAHEGKVDAEARFSSDSSPE